MGRRIKESPECHRERIANSAEHLFIERGIAATTMDEVAKAAGYSKATLYVYYEKKEELVGYLTLKSMKLLLRRLSSAIEGTGNARERFFAVCEELVAYQREYPLYFEMILAEINVDFEGQGALAVERSIFEIGEQVNALLAKFIREGMESGSFRADLQIPQTVFLFWGSLSGTILLAAHKTAYIQIGMGVTAQEFLLYGFKTLYRSVERMS